LSGSGQQKYSEQASSFLWVSQGILGVSLPKKFIYLNTRPRFKKNVQGRTLFDKQFEGQKDEILSWIPQAESLVSEHCARIQQLENDINDKTIELFELHYVLNHVTQLN